MLASGQGWLTVTIHVDHLKAQLQHPSVPLHSGSQFLPEARCAQHPQRDCKHPLENSPVLYVLSYFQSSRLSALTVKQNHEDDKLNSSAFCFYNAFPHSKSSLGAT